VQIQFILQFRGDARAQYDQVADPLEALASTLKGVANLDGDDVGAHGVNVFLFTNDVHATFKRALNVFPGARAASGFSAAYRQVSNDTFQVLWPENSPTKFQLR